MLNHINTYDVFNNKNKTTNSIWQNNQRIKTDLIAEGVDADEAQYLSTIRMFSNQSGDYGSGVDDATWASDTWETDKKYQIII